VRITRQHAIATFMSIAFRLSRQFKDLVTRESHLIPYRPIECN
jgi:hypothetical protein